MHDHAQDVRRLLTDPERLVDALGLGERKRRNGNGWLVLCPWHAEKTPSCSVRLGPDGTVQVRCHGCGKTGDALTLIQAVNGGGNFQDALADGARIAGDLELESEIRDGRTAESSPRPPMPRPAPQPDRQYPPQAELDHMWAGAGSVEANALVARYLESRAIDPGAVATSDLARALTWEQGQRLPRWARYRGEADETSTWWELGHYLIVPGFDSSGALRSMRAWRCGEGRTPKRLPPAGHRGDGIVLANDAARGVLAGKVNYPVDAVFTEGEPDFLTWATRISTPVFGVLSGTWEGEHATAFASRFAAGSRFRIRVHLDEAGEKYTRKLVSTLKGRGVIYRIEG